MDTPLIPDELSNEERVSGVWWKQIIAGGGAGAGEGGRGGYMYIVFSVNQQFPLFLSFSYCYCSSGPAQGILPDSINEGKVLHYR